MDDLTMTKLCAEAMGLDIGDDFSDCDPPVQGIDIITKFGNRRYDPLHDDAQAMALAKRFEIEMFRSRHGGWDAMVDVYSKDGECVKVVRVFDADLSRAIVGCVAQMQVDRTAQETAAMGKAV